jgi:hypothetical protein
MTAVTSLGSWIAGSSGELLFESSQSSRRIVSGDVDEARRGQSACHVRGQAPASPADPVTQPSGAAADAGMKLLSPVSCTDTDHCA